MPWTADAANRGKRIWHPFSERMCYSATTNLALPNDIQGLAQIVIVHAVQGHTVCSWVVYCMGLSCDVLNEPEPLTQMNKLSLFRDKGFLV